MKELRLAIGSDSAGLEYRDVIEIFLRTDSRITELVKVDIDQETTENYPGVAFKVATLISDGTVDRAILICGTGMGMAISANKVKGIRASTAHDSYSVERLIKSNCRLPFL